MQKMTDQLGMYFHMIKTMLDSKVSDERGDAVQWVLIILAGIAIVGIVVAAVTAFVQNKAAEIN